jgi:hypothetical protein
VLEESSLLTSGNITCEQYCYQGGDTSAEIFYDSTASDP